MPQINKILLVLLTLGHLLLYYYFLLALIRIFGSRIFFLIRSFVGVTSRSSSVSMNSSASSRLKILGGTRRRASSALDERVFVSCLRLHTLTSISSVLPF